MGVGRDEPPLDLDSYHGLALNGLTEQTRPGKTEMFFSKVIIAPKGLLCRGSKNLCSSVRSSVRHALDGPQIGTPKYVNLRREKLFNWLKNSQKTSFGHVFGSRNYVNLRRGKLFNWSKTVQKRVLVTFWDS